MPTLHVTFDTNVYRTLSPARLETLQRLERACSVMGVASHSVVLELLSHLASPNDPDFAPAKGGLRRLVAHCRRYDGARYSLPNLASLDEQLAAVYFGSQLYSGPRHPGDLGWLLGAFTPEAEVDGAHQHRDALGEVAEFAASIESEFARAIWETVVLKIVPGANDWGAFVANGARRQAALSELASAESAREVPAALVRRVAAALGRELADDERDTLVSRVGDELRDVVQLHVAVMTRIVRDGLDLRLGRNSNTVWDLRIASSALAFAALDPRPFWLVTDDGPLVTAARQSDTRGVVHTLAEYEVALQDGTVTALRP